MLRFVDKKRYQAVDFPCNRMLKLSSRRGIRIDVPVLSVSWSFEDHSVIIQALKKGLIEYEASDTGAVPRWKSSCPDRLAEATGDDTPKNICTPIWGYFKRTPRLFYLGYTAVSHSIPSGPINVQSTLSISKRSIQAGQTNR